MQNLRNRVPAIEERHYIARDNIRTGAVVALSKDEEKIYDAYDCPMCGCQIIAQERKRNFESYSIDDFSDDECEESEDDNA